MNIYTFKNNLPISIKHIENHIQIFISVYLNAQNYAQVIVFLPVIVRI